MHLQSSPPPPDRHNGLTTSLFAAVSCNLNPTPFRRVALLAGGDAAVLFAFAVIGRINHGEPIAGALDTALPFMLGESEGLEGVWIRTCLQLGGRILPQAHGKHATRNITCRIQTKHMHIQPPGWFATAPFLGGYGKEARGGAAGPAALTAAKCWAAGAPLGLVIRGVSKGYVPPTPFIVVSLVATAVLMVGWRAALAAATPEAAPLSPAAAAQKRQNKRGNPFEFITLLMSLTKRW